MQVTFSSSGINIMCIAPSISTSSTFQEGVDCLIWKEAMSSSDLPLEKRRITEQSAIWYASQCLVFEMWIDICSGDVKWASCFCHLSDSIWTGWAADWIDSPSKQINGIHQAKGRETTIHIELQIPELYLAHQSHNFNQASWKPETLGSLRLTLGLRSPGDLIHQTNQYEKEAHQLNRN